MKLKKFKKNNKRNTMIIIAAIFVVGLVVSTNLIKSHANFNTSRSFNIIQGKIPNKNNGDVTLAVKLDGEKYKEVGFPSKKGHNFKGYECTNGGVLTWNPETWRVLIDTDKPTVCILEFETTTNFVEYLKGTGELTEFNHSATEQTPALTDYRYTGANPNNYVKFNDELWEVIGVIPTQASDTSDYIERVKIIRSESIGILAWDENNTNDWTNATLKTLLNSGDYYNRTGTYASIGLTNASKNQISDAKWYLGTYPYDGKETGEERYKEERSTVTTGTNPVNWIGKVGLLYPTDVVFAGGAECPKNSVKSNCGGWLPRKRPARGIGQCNNTNMSPYIDNESGFSWWSNAPEYGQILPVVFLSSEIEVASGDGTKDNPFQLVIN